MRLNALAFAVMCVPLGALAQVYKWVDDKGVTHYGASPPPNAKSREVQVPTGGSGAKPPAARPSVAEQEAAFRERQIQREEAAAKETNDRAQHQKRCRSLRSSTDAMKAARRVYSPNEVGERVILDDKEREVLIAKREAEYNRYCQ